ncbi:MAG TPA: thioredoxin domain-containing protein [Usitatibacter sp.]|nr:thioredoxin domain-containing protein [Usitatibacter sp.]
MPNRLANETSPYLQQHADNPVDWYPWGEEALAEAKLTGKPILLSVGYSACHWCHVMAHESFEDASIAKVMNDLFVNIKVDREERPDIDQIYQVAQAMITQRNGGWPLTMFLTPDQLPFFGGTYFPNVSRYGMPAFPELLKRVRQYYDENPEEVRGNGEHVVTALARNVPTGGVHPSQFSALVLDEAAAHLEESFDRRHGGFSGAPKFPHPDSIELLLRRHARTGDTGALEMAAFTLRRMAEGGIYDQVGGGFARYSVDAEWAIPHFEKMLYDNGWLLRLYADAWAVKREPLFEKVARETAQWVMREMQSPEGGYYSSLDADSEGEEGKYYVWTVDEVRALLSADELAAATLRFGLDQPRNFEDHAWHLVVSRPVAEVARALGSSEADVGRLIESTRAKLYAAREKRVRPGRDEKVLTSWNALMIAGMARAGRVFGRPEWIESARRALDFIRRVLVADGRLLATYKDGRAHLDAYLDDHAYLLAALLEMLQADFRAADLEWAEELGAQLMDRFHDPEAGGFFFTSHGHESLIHRPKPGPDNATPSGNAVAALALHRLAFLTGETRYSDAAAGTIALYWTQMQRQPTAFGTMLAALEEQLEPPGTVILRGETPAMAPWHRLLDAAYLPTRITLFVPRDTHPLPPPLDKPVGDTVNAWVCEGVTCLPPIASPEELREALELPTIARSILHPPTARSDT